MSEDQAPPVMQFSNFQAAWVSVCDFTRTDPADEMMRAAFFSGATAAMFMIEGAKKLDPLKQDMIIKALRDELVAWQNLEDDAPVAEQHTH